MVQRRFKKKNSIIWLAVLMGISVLGIVAAQYLWISQSLSIQEEQLEKSAYIAINRAVARIEREQSAALMLNPFFQNHNQIPPSSVSPFHQPQPSLKMESKGRMEAHFNVNGKEFSKTFDWDGSSTGQGQPSLNETLAQVEDSIRQMMGMMNEDDNALIQLFKQMAHEFESRRTPLMQEFNMNDISRILAEELQNMGVKMPVEYAVVENNSGQITEYRSKNYQPGGGRSIRELNVAMFPNNILRLWSDYRLSVQLPFTTLFLMRTQASLLGISALFTLFILATFLATMRTIIHQKKVSDIKSDFINNMTHEFKTPIATISLATDSIATPSILEKPEVIKSFLNIIKEENARMNSQVERILQMALIDKKDFSIMPATTDINELIRKAVQNMSLFISESGGNVELNMNAEPAQANVDTVHFTNVVVNLIENAIKYSKEAPRVMVSTTREKDAITLKVRDFGIGMNKEQQNKIFEKFYRATSGNIHNVKGFGLGLSYVKAVVDAHGGSIDVKSKLNEGSEFTITIPA
ncbi:MAG: sensor histidine kinase [Breznakibacter sp.]